MADLEPAFLQNFMGCGDRRAGFRGHGVGLQIDEMPALAEGFDEPLAAGMVLALEPKKGIPGVGLVGIEDTFVVTPQGGRSLTGTHPGLPLIEGCPSSHRGIPREAYLPPKTRRPARI